jgi:uncharacterized protein with von Willebrand factor type A (vWA) domain
MSMFSIIREKIMEHHAQQAPQAQPAQPTQPPASGEQPDLASTLLAGMDVGSLAAGQLVDVEQVLEDISQQKGNPNLNWRSSIVDLMKLLDLDSSLANRAELATELGYQGEKNGSAEMNIWLHRRVMEELEKSGGRVPDSLKG